MKRVGLSVLLAQALLSAQSGQAPPPAPTGIIAGRVVDASGAPIAGAVVTISSTTPGASGAAPAQPAPRTGGGATASPAPLLTDDRGRFAFTSLAAGGYGGLSASKPGWLTGAYGRRRPGGAASTIDLAVGERRSDLVITMWRPAVIAGRVTADNGDPLVGAEVRAIPLTFIAGRRQPDTPIRQKTDDRGVYRFSNLMPGEYLVAVLGSVLSEPPGFAGAIVAAGDRPRAYLQTMTGIGAAPMLFDRATTSTGSNRPLVASLSDLPGLPEADDKAPWPIYPTAFHPSGTLISSANVVVAVSGAPKEDIDVHAQLTPTWQVSGILSDANGPAAWHAVHLVAAESGDTPLIDVGTAVTDHDGAFTIFGVPPGRYIARVVRVPWPSAPGNRLATVGSTGQIPSIAIISGSPTTGAPSMPAEPLVHASEDVVVSRDHVRGLRLTLREGPRVRGRVRFDGQRQQPSAQELQAVTVTLEPADGRTDRWFLIMPGRFSNDGSFATPHQWPGRYLIRSSAPPGWTFKEAIYQGRNVSDVPVELSTDLDDVTIVFTDRPHRIAGTVTAEPGATIDGAIVLLFTVDPAGWVDYGRASRRVTSTVVDRSGAFTMPAPPDGEYHLIAIPEEQSAEWRNPAVLKGLAALAQRIRLSGVELGAQTLRLRDVGK